MRLRIHGADISAAPTRSGIVALAIAGVLFLAGSVEAGHSLTNPVPREAMRPLSTDRPDVAESPYTVDAGHFQVELDFFSSSRDASEGFVFEQLSFMTSNLKLGLSDRVDVQLVVRPYVRRTVGGPATSGPGGSSLDATASGLGDTDIRVKINMGGNDGGSSAFALLPFVSLPTASDDLGAPDPSYGLAVPLALQLVGGTTASFMVQLTGTEDASALLISTSFSRNLSGDLGGFVEMAGTRPRVNGRSLAWIPTLNTGLTFGVTEEVQLDGAVLLGLTDDATDFTGYLGLSVRR